MLACFIHLNLVDRLLCPHSPQKAIIVFQVLIMYLLYDSVLLA